MIRGVSFLIPKQSGLWVFVGWHRSSEGEVFADNSKYMFLEVFTHTDIKAIWLTGDRDLVHRLRARGLSAYHQMSWRGLLIALRAEIIFTDSHLDIYTWRTAGGSKVVQLWHGKGFKKVAKATKTGISHLNHFWHPYLKAKYDYLVASSKYTAELMKDSFGVKHETMLITGLPRNDVLFREIKNADIDTHPELRSIVENKELDEKLILYAPTFRRYEYDPLACLDESVLHQYLEDSNSKLVVSMHPKFYKRKWQRDNRSSRIIFISPGYDIYPFISNFDCLISDYGSLFLEFVCIDKHCIFLIPDLVQFKENTGLYDDYDSLTPGPKVSTIEEVCTALGDARSWSDRREKVRSTMFTYHDGCSAMRIMEALK